MFKGLQNHAGRDRQISTPARPIEIILDNNYANKARAFVATAHSEIRLCAYAWRWYDSEPELPIQRLNIDLLTSAKRGVSIRALVDTEAMAAKFRALGFDVRAVQPTRMLHTKAICIDTRTLILGSHNLTKRANTDNYEMSVAIQEYEAVAQFVEYFDRLWSARG